MSFGRLTHEQIADTVKHITREEMLSDLAKLREVGQGRRLTAEQLKSKVGEDAVNFFTFKERLETRGNKGINFFELIKRAPEFKKKDYVKKMIEYYRVNRPGWEPLKIWYRIFSIYFGSINIFQPIITMNLYKVFGATRILNPCMGWGGNLISAGSLDSVDSYIGIDTNMELVEPYRGIVSALKDSGSRTKIRLLFKDVLKVDYNRLQYDMVFSSPPFYNIEVYTGMTTHQSREEWETAFYTPFFTRTWAGLEKGGWYCINVPVDIYERVLHPLLGVATRKLPRRYSARGNNYKEFIYCWHKPDGR
jgi:hypothetical protein